MTHYTYHHEIRTMLGHFAAAFNDVIVKRFDKHNNEQDSLKVAYTFGPKQRVFYDLVQNKTNIRLPLINVSLTNIARASDRTANKIASLAHNIDHHSSHFVNVAAPVPISLSISMTIVTKYMRDLEQILTNFIPYADPYIVVSWNHPITNQELQSHISWSGNAPIQSPAQLESTTPYQWTCDTDFTMDGWLFKHDQPAIGKIFKINSTYTAVPEIFCNLTDNEHFMSPDTTDTFAITATPVPLIVDRYMIAPNQSTYLTIFGKMFDHVTGVYLSGGSGLTIPSATSWNLFANVTSDLALSSACSALTAAAAPNFIVGQVTNISNFNISERMQLFEQTATTYSGSRQTNNANRGWNMITVNIPAMSGSGYFDIIVVNEAGCGSLKRNSFLSLANPYLTSDPLYSTWNSDDYQYPWYNKGIGVGLTDIFVVSAAQVVRIDCVASVDSNLHGQYFVLWDQNGSCSFTWSDGRPQKSTLSFAGQHGFTFQTFGEGRWFQIETENGLGCYWFNTGTEFEPSRSSDFIHQIDINADMTADEVATAVLNALTQQSFIDDGSSGTTVRVASMVNAPFTVLITSDTGIDTISTQEGIADATPFSGAATNILIPGNHQDKTNTEVAEMIATYIGANMSVTCVANNGAVIVTDNAIGRRTDPDAGTSSFSFDVTVRGSGT